jgi:hypothetical protein
MPYISSKFAHTAQKPDIFSEKELLKMLNPVKEDYFQLELTSGKRQFTAWLSRHEDLGGHHERLTAMHFECRIEKEGQQTVSRVMASKVKGTKDMFQIRSILFDGLSVRTDSREEIKMVLQYLGKNHVATGMAGAIPVPHQQKGGVGKLRRFAARQIPDDPSLIPPM